MKETILVVAAVVVMFAALMFILHRRPESFLVPKNTIKHGNNGTVSCQTFCTGQWGGGPKGNCVRAHDKKTNKNIGCNVVRGIAGADVTCECGPKLATRAQIARRNDVLVSPNCILSGHALTSPNKMFRAVMQEDGNFVVYEKSKPVWASHFSQSATNSTIPISSANKPYMLCVDNAGNITVTDKKKVIVWSSDTGGKDTGPFTLMMQNDGHLVLRGQHVIVWGSKWTNRCANVMAWWKQNKNANAGNPWMDYVQRLKRKEYHVWPGPKCYNCEVAKKQYHLMYPDTGRGVDAALHAADHKDRVWKGMTACLPKAALPVAARIPTPAPPKNRPAHRPAQVPAHPLSTQGAPRVKLIDDWQQCGGMGGDSGDSPDKPVVDGPWPGQKCKSGTCLRDNQWYFKCAPGGAGPTPSTPTQTPTQTPTPRPTPRPAPTPTPAADSPYYNEIMAVRNRFDGSLFANKPGSYGSEVVNGLGVEKGRIRRMIDLHHGGDTSLYHLVITLGMLETKTMNVHDRDHEKDHMGWQTANYTFMNICGDLISRAVPSNNFNLESLGGSWLNADTDEQINAAIDIVKGGIRNLGGIIPYCNFVRGGYSGWADPNGTWETYKMGQYFHGLSFTLNKVMTNELGVTTNDVRLWVNVGYV